MNVVTFLLDPSAKKERLVVNRMQKIVVTAERATLTGAFVSADTPVIFVSCQSHQVCHAIVNRSNQVKKKKKGDLVT